MKSSSEEGAEKSSSEEGVEKSSSEESLLPKDKQGVEQGARLSRGRESHVPGTTRARGGGGGGSRRAGFTSRRPPRLQASIRRHTPGSVGAKSSSEEGVEKSLSIRTAQEVSRGGRQGRGQQSPSRRSRWNRRRTRRASLCHLWLHQCQRHPWA